MRCAICEVRKEKRFCPAMHGRICPQCCGEQREVTLDCPSDCPYLQQARQHHKPRSFEDMPPEEVFPKIELSEDFLRSRETLIAGLMQTLAELSRADRVLNDREVIAALVNMANSYRTLVNSGLVYDEVLPNPAQQAMIDVLRKRLQEFRKVEQQNLGYTALKDADVLKSLVFILRLAAMHTSGRPRSRAFLDYLYTKFAEPQPSASVAKEPGGRIIMP